MHPVVTAIIASGMILLILFQSWQACRNVRAYVTSRNLAYIGLTCINVLLVLVAAGFSYFQITEYLI